ncbi:MAG TPA: VWA domain-containing protein [Gaiellaceae bacterium]|nr:VWA domain-containing protein [Gaiellaceae bacterium]
MSFERPAALLALLAVPVLAGLWLWNEERRAASAARFSSLALLPNLVSRWPGRRRYIPVGLLLLALVALVVGMARPHANLTVPRKAATVVLAVDISRSMTATDVAPTRLDAARNAAYAFLAEVPKTYSVAVVAFGSRAFVAVPPTLDRSLVATALGDLRPGQGTAIGDAVRIAAELGQTQRKVDGVVPPTSVLLISDGAPDGGRTTAEAGAKRAKALHVPVSTVLVGTANGVVTAQLTGGYTEQIRVPPSPGTLQLIARVSGGQFFRARTSAAVREVYERLATRIGHRTENREVTDMFAGGAIVLLLAGGGLSAFWFRRIV